MMNRFSFLLLAVTLAAATACDENGNGDDTDTACTDVLEPDVADDVVPDCMEHGTLPAGACRMETDCADGRHCFAPGEPNCGICMPIENPCEVDETCLTEPDTVCDYPVHNDCLCNWDKACMPPCGVDGGTVCDSQDRPVCVDGHCVATPCESDDGCLEIFRCMVDDNGRHCERRTCTADGDCGGCGWCVYGACYDEPGNCEYMAP